MTFFGKCARNLAGLSVLLLAGCGSSGSGGDVFDFAAAPPGVNPFVYSGVFADEDATGSAALTQIFYNLETQSIQTRSVTATSSADGITLSDAGRTGDLNDENTSIFFSNERLQVAGSSYGDVILIDSATRTGVMGLPATDVPARSAASYSGGAAILVNNGEEAFDLRGQMDMDVNFAANSGTIYFQRLGGVATNANGDTRNITSAGGTIFDASVNTGGLNGGLLQLTGQIATNEAVYDRSISHQGRFFGPGAETVGGVAVLDATPSGEEFKFVATYQGRIDQ